MNHFLTRTCRRLIALIGLGAFVFAQSVVAATFGSMLASSAPVESATPPCHSVSAPVTSETPVALVCKQHCQADTLTLDHAEVPPPLVPILPALHVEDAYAARLSTAHVTEMPVHGGSPPTYLISARLRV